MVLMIQSEDNN